MAIGRKGLEAGPSFQMGGMSRVCVKTRGHQKAQARSGKLHQNTPISQPLARPSASRGQIFRQGHASIEKRGTRRDCIDWMHRCMGIKTSVPRESAERRLCHMPILLAGDAMMPAQ